MGPSGDLTWNDPTQDLFVYFVKSTLFFKISKYKIFQKTVGAD